ncbi:chorismate-binding protein [Streptomyces caniscabiei]|uniref:anthranilate synthase family protein n=1 Tax=Streptomyces caniscabiei TaxID=2746961 RepID=UPI0029A93372|nr:chorismate-binding protein [Streptomyces caniscabiei]MDX2600093.1 chorismate-binding protein [Streptomyces caniscabiei]MDX2734614.1 chorismate-binding protein [Streptomyces caniscabiei]MDX2777201.1 chorismate-binding protein [Streptomyces caniscabiei]
MTSPRASAPQDPLDRVLAPQPPPFALLHRPETVGPGLLEVVIGEVSTLDSLAELPLRTQPAHPGRAAHEVLALLPFRQIAERGFACADDGEPLLAMTVTDQAVMTVADAVRRIPEVPIEVTGKHFDVDDDTYAQIVRDVIKDEIGEGEGANFVIHRSLVADITDYTLAHALCFFRRLLECEQGAYWTYLVHTGERTLVGAGPERHISLHDGVAVMNPISGTYRYPASGPTLPDVMAFLADPKETDELYMVVDEELKMMARICPDGCRVTGPYLKEMARVAHTEYFVEGRTSRDVREILRETMFAPTVTGSPLESACRVISRHEPRGRGYYSGAVAVIGHDDAGERTLDSSILIRTADIDGDGRLRIGVGATLVRHSDPRSEVEETRAKAAGLLTALESDRSPGFGAHPHINAALARRNDTIAGFWLADAAERERPDSALVGRSALIIDAEDTFTFMLDQQLRALGLEVTVRRYDEPYRLDTHDLVVMGPGPGDPRDTDHPKIAHLAAATDRLLESRQPFLSVCLSHQVLATRLGFPLRRRDVPNQGVQKEINLFGSLERVGFYNAFAARSDEDKADCPGIGVLEISRSPETGEIHALRGPHFSSLQFHAESLLTRDGPRILREATARLLHDRVSGRPD